MKPAPGRVTVVAALAAREGLRLFLARRSPGLRHGGLWELPGGKVEAGEEAGAALLRELREELGLEAALGPEFGRFDTELEGRAFRFIVFRVDFRGEPSHMAAHDRLGWFAKDELPLDKLAPLDLPILEAWMKEEGRLKGRQ